MVKRGRGGVQYEDLIPGLGPEAERGSKVEVRYTLTLNRGEVLQRDRFESFTLGQREVIAGLRYGIEGMRVGGLRRLRVGPHLAYGSEGHPPDIPADAVLVFEVLLLAARSPRR